MGKFLAVMYPREELVKMKVVSCIPSRRVEEDGTSRRTPTLAFLDKDTYTRTRNGVKENDIEKWIWEKVKKPSKIQEKKMSALTLMAIAKEIFQNHLYKFNGQLYKQRSGGPIGDNATNDAADVVMWIFITHYKRSLSRLGISKETVLLKVYVDDLNQAGLRLPYGTQYIRGRLYIPGRGWSGRAPDGQAITKEEKKEIEETAERLAMEARTPDQEEAASARVFREIANTILPDSIRMKEDVPSAHQRRALPILDT